MYHEGKKTLHDNKSQDYDKIRIFHADITRQMPIFFQEVYVFDKISKVPSGNCL